MEKGIASKPLGASSLHSNSVTFGSRFFSASTFSDGLLAESVETSITSSDLLEHPATEKQSRAKSLLHLLQSMSRTFGFVGGSFCFLGFDGLSGEEKFLS